MLKHDKVQDASKVKVTVQASTDILNRFRFQVRVPFALQRYVFDKTPRHVFVDLVSGEVHGEPSQSKSLMKVKSALASPRKAAKGEM